MPCLTESVFTTKVWVTNCAYRLGNRGSGRWRASAVLWVPLARVRTLLTLLTPNPAFFWLCLRSKGQKMVMDSCCCFLCNMPRTGLASYHSTQLRLPKSTIQPKLWKWAPNGYVSWSTYLIILFGSHLLFYLATYSGFPQKQTPTSSVCENWSIRREKSINNLTEVMIYYKGLRTNFTIMWTYI